MDNPVVTGTVRGTAFIAALLLALAAVLVPAFIHSGLPATRAIGSAFDPSTSVVAMRARAPEAASVQAAEPDRRADPPSPSGPAHAVAPTPAAPVRHEATAQPAPQFHETRAESATAPTRSNALPRAPPFASPR